MPHLADPCNRNERRRGPFDRAAYRARNVVERLIGRGKQFRRLATRDAQRSVRFRATWIVVARILGRSLRARRRARAGGGMRHRDNDDGLSWYQSNGGPLLLLDRPWLPAWGGYPDPALPFDSPAHDYGRARAVADALGLVLGDEPLATAWWPAVDQRGGVLIRWRWANDDIA